MTDEVSNLELKTKYHYTYFIYPFVVEEKNYKKFITKAVVNDKWKIKLYKKDEDIEADSHFLSLAKSIMFPTLAWSEKKFAKFESLSLNSKAKILADLPSASFEYKLDNFSKGRVGLEERAVFFEITKMKLMCFKDGICFLMLKAEIDTKDYAQFSELLNLNYKFRNISPKYNHLKNYDYIKIQTSKFDTIEDIRDFIKEVCDEYEDLSNQDVYSNRLFVYSYACLDESEWNNTKDFEMIRDEFLKYQYVLAGDYRSEFVRKLELNNTYSRWKYSIYGFAKTAGVVFSSAIDHFNFTKLPFYYENVYMYIMLYALYQRLLYIIVLKELGNNKRNIHRKIQKITNMTALGQVTNAEHGMNLWQNWSRVFGLNEMYDFTMGQYAIYRKKGRI